MIKSHSIYHNLYINASAKEVFDAVSLPQHLNNWWPLKSSGKPKLGAVYNLNFTDEYNWFGTVAECKLNESFFIPVVFRVLSNAPWVLLLLLLCISLK